MSFDILRSAGHEAVVVCTHRLTLTHDIWKVNYGGLDGTYNRNSGN